MILRANATRIPLPDESISSVVCDPPYGLGFMNKSWDSVGYEFHLDWALECLRVLRPGGHLVAFGGTRTVHRLACAIEDAGFEIRDTIAWLQFQGFPKSLDVSKAIDAAAIGANQKQWPTNRDNQTRDCGGGGAVDYNEYRGEVLVSPPATPLAIAWQGWGTALKPAHEPAILARKPLEGTVAANVAKHGCGALNIDACRYEQGDSAWPGPQDGSAHVRGRNGEPSATRRYTEAGSSDFAPTPGPRGGSDLGRYPANIYATPKASRAEREAGCAELPVTKAHIVSGREEGSKGMNSPRAGIRAGSTGEGRNEPGGEIRNSHPTVKPIALMRWLIRLVTPPGGVCLDLFAGSGTTICAAHVEGIKAIGIEIDPDYARIAKARSDWWAKHGEASLVEAKAEAHDREVGQLGLF